jgi:hypothetical protein
MKSYPNFGISYTGGNTKILKDNKKLGFIYSLGYSSSRRVGERTRSDYQIDKFFLYENYTSAYDQRNQLNALFNMAYSYKKSKISWKNIFNNDFSKVAAIRNGFDKSNDPNTFYYKSQNSEAMGNGLFNSVLEGLHSLSSSWKLDWNGSRHTPLSARPNPDIPHT